MKSPARWMAVAATATMVTALAGCSTLDKLNPFSSSTSKAKPAELAPIQPTAELAISWQANIGAAGDSRFTPAVVGDSVYAAAQDGSLARLDGGRQIWRIGAGQKLTGGVGSDGNLVVVGTGKGEVLAFDAETGAALWKARASSEVLAAPAIGEGLVVVRSGDSVITGFDAKDGKRRWVYRRSTPALSLRSDVGAVLAEGGVVAGFPGGKLVALNPQNGAAIWEATVATPKGTTELERVADVSSPPVVDSREICAVSFQGRVACFEIASGNLLWSRDISSSAGLDMDRKRVYVSDDNGTIHAFARDSGASVWKQDKLARRLPTRPVALGKHVAVADLHGVVHLLDAETGDFAARLNTDGSAVLADPRRLDDGLVVQTKNGGIFGLDRR